jgi:hypothetical protein
MGYKMNWFINLFKKKKTPVQRLIVIKLKDGTTHKIEELHDNHVEYFKKVSDTGHNVYVGGVTVDGTEFTTTTDNIKSIKFEEIYK